MSGWALTSSLIPSRTVRWSSARRIRIVSILFLSFDLRGHFDVDRCALPGRRLDLQTAADDLCPLAHADQSQAGCAVLFGSRVKADAVVLDDHGHGAAPLFE